MPLLGIRASATLVCAQALLAAAACGPSSLEADAALLPENDAGEPADAAVTDAGSDASQAEAEADADADAPDLGTDYYRDVPHLIIFPLEQDVDYAYERSWHDCRPSEANCERAHRAVAIYAPLDTPVYAATDGEIAFRGTDGTSGGGYQLHVDTTDGAEIRYVYAHLGPNEQGAESDAFAANPRTGSLWDQGDEVMGDRLGPGLCGKLAFCGGWSRPAA